MLMMIMNAFNMLQNLEKNSQRTQKIKPFINKYNWKGVNALSGKDDWKHFEKNNLTIAFNELYAKKNEYISCLHFKTQFKLWSPFI